MDAQMSLMSVKSGYHFMQPNSDQSAFSPAQKGFLSLSRLAGCLTAHHILLQDIMFLLAFVSAEPIIYASLENKMKSEAKSCSVTYNAQNTIPISPRLVLVGLQSV
jgi:hypothetical protein